MDLARKLFPLDKAERERWITTEQDNLDQGKIEELVRSLRSIQIAHPDLAEGHGCDANWRGWTTAADHDRLEAVAAAALAENHQRRWTTATPGAPRSRTFNNLARISAWLPTCIFQWRWIEGSST